MGEFQERWDHHRWCGGGLGYSVAQRTWWGGGWKDRTQDRVCGEITLKAFEKAIWKPVMVKFS